MSAAAQIIPMEKPKKVLRKPTTNKTKPHRRVRPTVEQIHTMSAVDQVRHAFAPHQRLSALMGFVLGGFVPLAVFTLVHQEVAQYPILWVLVAGGLIYSAITIYKWSLQAFRMPAKAFGFVVLLEGMVTFSHTHWLALSGLAILIGINGVSAAVSLQARHKE